MVKIEDVVVPSKGTAKYFGITCLQISINKLSEATPTFYWSIASEDIVEEVASAGSTLLDGNLSMTTEEYSTWAADDSYIIDWALAKLGFTEIN
jgi:hypothetical protein